MGNDLNWIQKMKAEYIGNDIESVLSNTILYISAAEKAIQLGISVSKYGIGSFTDMNMTFTVGLMTGLFDNATSSSKENRELYNEAVKEFIESAKTIDNLYSSHQQKLERTYTDDIAREILRMPEDHFLIGESNIPRIDVNVLKAAEKIALQHSASHKDSNSSRQSLKIKSCAFAFLGYINASLFDLGKHTGGLIRESVITATQGTGLNEKISPEAQEKITGLLKQGFSLYLSFINTEKKVTGFSKEILSMSTSAVTGYMLGICATMLKNKELLSLSRNDAKRAAFNFTNNVINAVSSPITSVVSTTNLALNAVASICADFIISYKEQVNKTNVLNKTLSETAGIQKALQQGPTRKANDMFIQKNAANDELGKELNSYLNVVNSCMVAAKATVLSSSLRLGESTCDALLKSCKQPQGMSR